MAKTSWQTCSLRAIVLRRLGKTNTKPPRTLLLKKCGLGEKFTGNAATTEWGTQQEPIAIKMFEEQYGEKVNELGLIPHEKYPWLGGSPDGLTDTNCLVEIKCPMMRAIVPGEVPRHYLPQVQLCMEIMDVETCFFVQYHTHRNFLAERSRIWRYPLLKEIVSGSRPYLPSHERVLG